MEEVSGLLEDGPAEEKMGRKKERKEKRDKLNGANRPVMIFLEFGNL